MTAGRPPERSIQILELWISIIDRDSDLQLDSRFSTNFLKDRLINSNLYLKNPENYQQSVLRLPDVLKTGFAHGLFECENEVIWNLSREVGSIIKSKKFKDERKDDFDVAVRTIWETLRNRTWQDYYNPKPISSIEIPPSLKNLQFQLPVSGQEAKWINPDGIHLEDIMAEYFPAKTLKMLKIRIEEQWRKNKLVILVADPAQGKTTTVSILSYWWEKEAINNIIFKFEAKRWFEIQFVFEKYVNEVTVFDRVIIVLENVHLASQLDSIQKLNRKENVNFILTSRRYEEKLKPFKNSNQHIIFPLPISYSKELLTLFLKQYGPSFTKNKQLIHGLLKDTVNQNILFLLTHTIEKIGKEEIFAWDNFISELEERLLSKEDSDKYFWRWILYSLAVMRYYELDISKQTLFEIIKLYDKTLSRKYLGITFTALEENGIIQSSGYEKNRHKLVFHPNVAKKIKEYYSNDMKQIMGNLIEIDDKLFKLWIENKESLDDKRSNFYPIEIETLIRKIGFERYNKLDLDIEFWKERILSSDGNTDNYLSFHRKTQFIALNYKQKNLKNLLTRLLDETYFFQFLLSDSLEIDIPEVIPEFERNIIKENILDIIDVTQVKLSKFFNEFEYEIDLGSSNEGYLGNEYRGYKAFYYLSLNHPKFREEVEKHIRYLYEQEKYRIYLETIFRISVDIIGKIDFQYVTKDISFFEKFLFLVNNHMIELEGDFFVQTTYDLLELWNGPKLEDLSSVLLKYVKERIKENKDFIETEKDYFSSSKIDIWIDNAEIQNQLKEMDLIAEFDMSKFIEKKPEWILKRLEFFRKYNIKLYKHLIKSDVLKSKLEKIEKKYYEHTVLKELGIRPPLYEISFHKIVLKDLQHANYDQLKQQIEKNLFKDWDNFLQKLLLKLEQYQLEDDQTANKLKEQIKDLIEYLNALRSKTSKEKYLSILKTKIDETPSYETRTIEEIVKAFFKVYTLDVSHLIELGYKFESKFNKGYRTNNPIWDLGYSMLRPNGKHLFIKELLKQERKNKCFLNFIKKDSDKEIFTKSLIQLIDEDKLNLISLLSSRNDAKNLASLLDCSQLEFFIDYLLNIELKKSDSQFFFLVEITKKLKEAETIHKFIFQFKKFNSIVLFKLYVNLSNNKIYNFLQFLYEEWPVNNIYQKVCDQIGLYNIANLLGKSLGILKSVEEKKTPNYYQRNKGFLIENARSKDILSELLLMINFKNLDEGEENRVVFTIAKYLKDNNKESLLKELPFILIKVVNEKKMKLFELINPKEFNSVYIVDFDFLTNFISNFQQLQIEMRKEVMNLVIIWNSAESRYNRLKATDFIQIIESIWNWHDFSEETKKWDKSSREILFNYFIEDLLELYTNLKSKKNTLKINDDKSDFHNVVSKISFIFEIDEKFGLLKLKLDEVLLNEDLSTLNLFIQLLRDEFEDIIGEILKEYIIDDWMFYYSLKMQENEFELEHNLRKIIELAVILNEIKDKLSFNFDNWFYSIIKQSPKELLFLLFEQNYLKLPKEAIRRISKLKAFQNWNLKDIFSLLLKSINTENFEDLWHELVFFQNKQPTTSTELNYILALLLILKFSNKNGTVYESLESWLKSIETTIYSLFINLEEGYKIILEVFLGLNLKINLSKNQLAFFSILNYPEIDCYFEDNPYIGFNEIIRNEINSTKIWDHYWKKQKNNCLGFIRNLNFEYLIRLLENENLFEIFMNNLEIQDVILESLIYDKFMIYIKHLKRHKSLYRNIPALSVFSRLINSAIKQRIFDSLAREDFKLIKELLLRYFSSDITSGLNIINQIKYHIHEIESYFILEYEREDNLYGFSKSLSNIMIKRSASAQIIITDLEFARENLPDIFRYTILNTDYSTVKNYLRDSNSSSDYQEVIWYLGTLDLWKINATNLARELVKNTYFRDYELPFIIKHIHNIIDERIKAEIKKELERDKKYKNDKNHFKIKMENILLTWSKNNL